MLTTHLNVRHLLPITLALTAAASALLAGPRTAHATSPTRVPRAAATIDSIERSEVALINRHRRAHGLPLLRIDARLTRAAGWMALDMGRTARFSHTDSLGRDSFTRIRAFGYPSNDTWRGENLAAGNNRPGPTFRQWRTSPPHYKNMVTARYRAIGIARVRVPGSPYRWYWATTFGSRWVSSPE